MAATVAIVRILVDDPLGANQIFADSHYQVIVDIESNEYRAAAVAARTLAAHFAQKVSTSVDKVKIENQQKSEAYIGLAKSYDKAAAAGGGTFDAAALGTPVITGISESEMDSVREDTDRYPPSFERGLHDNSNACSACGGCGCDRCGCC